MARSGSSSSRSQYRRTAAWRRIAALRAEMLRAQAESGETISIDEFRKVMRKYRDRELARFREFFNLHDQDGSGQLTAREVREAGIFQMQSPDGGAAEEGGGAADEARLVVHGMPT